MKQQTALVIMAAGIGSRFGTGIKQLTKMNDAGEIIIDYSIYDAREAGFDKVVFVIRHAIEEEFKEVIGNRISKVIPVEYVYQELEDLPSGFTAPAGRTKPWGTGQAILACKGKVDLMALFLFYWLARGLKSGRAKAEIKVARKAKGKR